MGVFPRTHVWQRAFLIAALAARHWEELPADSIVYMGVFPRTHVWQRAFMVAALAARHWEALPADSIVYMGVFPRTHDWQRLFVVAALAARQWEALLTAALLKPLVGKRPNQDPGGTQVFNLNISCRPLLFFRITTSNAEHGVLLTRLDARFGTERLTQSLDFRFNTAQGIPVV
jgi:hypothetical protein